MRRYWSEMFEPVVVAWRDDGATKVKRRFRRRRSSKRKSTSKVVVAPVNSGARFEPSESTLGC